MTNRTPDKRRGGRLAHRAAERIRRVIRTLDAGDPLTTERQWSRRLGCSLTTVRNALAMLADEGLIDRRHGVGTFVSSSMARSDLLGLLFYGSVRAMAGSLFSRDVFWGVQEATDEAGVQIHLLATRKRHPVSVSMSDVSSLPMESLGALLCMEVFNAGLLRLIARRRPVVSIDFGCNEPGVSSCILDHGDSVQRLIEPLCLVGHRRIGLAGPARKTTDPAHQARLRAFGSELRRRGLPTRPEWMMHVTSRAEAEAEAEAFCCRHPAERPTAIVLTEVAYWPFVTSLVANGINVPGDVSLLALNTAGSWYSGLLDADRRAGSSEVGLSDPLDEQLAPLRSLVIGGLELPFLEMGRWAAGEALRRIREPDSPPVHRTFQGRLIPGNSLAPPRDRADASG